MVLVGLLIPILLTYSLATASEFQVGAVVAALLGLALIIARPHVGLILFVSLLYIRPEESIPALAGMHFTLLVAVVTLCGLLLTMALNKETFARTPLNWVIVLFSGFAVLTTLNNGNMSDAAQELAKNLVLVYLVVNLIRTPGRYRALVNALLVLTAYVSLFSIYKYFTGTHLVEEDAERSLATGIFSDPNDLAATIVAGLALCLARITQAKGHARVFYGVLILTDLAGIFMTNSRGGMLALLAVAGAFCLLVVKKKSTAIGIAVAVCTLFLVVGPSRMSSFDSKDESSNQRFWYWDNGINMLVSNPLTGVGYRHFPDVNYTQTAHNSFVLCFAELGLPGYILWLGGIYYGFRRFGPRKEKLLDEEGGADLIGARLAFLGFLVACFWISRTYIQVLYLLMALPIAAQLSFSADQKVFDLSSQERSRDWLRISGIALLSIVFIKVMVEHYK